MLPTMRFWKPSSAEAQALARAFRARQWRQLDRRRRRRLWWSRGWLTVRDRTAQIRQDGRILAGLVRDILVAALGTAAAVAAWRRLPQLSVTFCTGERFSSRSIRQATEHSLVSPSARRPSFLPCSSPPSG